MREAASIHQKYGLEHWLRNHHNIAPIRDRVCQVQTTTLLVLFNEVFKDFIATGYDAKFDSAR